MPEPVPGLVDLYRTPDRTTSDSGLVRLDRNERVQPLPEWFLDRMRQAVDNQLLTEYPAAGPLHEELAASIGVHQNQLLVAAGSDGAVRAAYQAYVRPGDGVVMLDPSYAMYAVYARMMGARATGIAFDREMRLPG